MSIRNVRSVVSNEGLLVALHRQAVKSHAAMVKHNVCMPQSDLVLGP